MVVSKGSIVSILVLMDVGLRYLGMYGRQSSIDSFNPCFNGCRSAIVPFRSSAEIKGSFNPCFNGCRSAISWARVARVLYLVSILVLMDVGLRSFLSSSYLFVYPGFNPCFNGCRSAIRLINSFVGGRK